jgi:uncharacterized oligopeptide transporter (OPT) family protein
LWLSTACTLGVLLAVPLRRHFVVDEKLPFVDGLSTAETILVLDPPQGASAEIKKNALAAFRAVMLGVLLSGALMVFRDDAKLFAGIIPEGWPGEDAPAWFAVGGVALSTMAVGASYSLLSVGSGMLIGLRIDWSMILGGTLAWVVAPYFLVKYGIPIHHGDGGELVATAHPRRTEVLFWVMWPATGMLVAGGLTALALRWRLLIETFRSLRGAKISSGELPLSVVITGALVSAVGLCIVQYVMLGMPVWMTVLAIFLSIPLMLVGLRVLGETSWGPISALSNMMQGIFAVVAPGNVVANMVASGTTGTIATSSESIMQDYKCGEMVGTKPRLLTIMQLLAVPIGAASVAIIYPVLVETYGITGDKAQLTSPISNKWAGFAAILEKGVSALPPSALWALVIFSVLGIFLTIAETNPRLRRFVPSPTGLGIGILVPFSVVFTMFVGGVLGTLWERFDKKSAELYLIPLASGLIAGEALIAVLVPLILKLGWGDPATLSDSLRWGIRGALGGAIVLVVMFTRRRPA